MPSTPRTRPGSPKPLLLWARVRDSLWFLPGIGALVGIFLAGGLLFVTFPERWEDTWVEAFLFSGNVDSARGVLSTIAGSLITVTGVVFSVTIVTLQLASTQFSPRVMRTFITDRTNQTVLATFIGTFTYTLVVLGALGSPAYGDRGVPIIATTFSIVLLLISVGGLIAFINRTARSAQVTTMLARESGNALGAARKLFPAGLGTPLGDEIDLPDSSPASVQARSGGYIQVVDGAAMLELAERLDLLVEMRISVGDFVFPGKEILRVWPAARATEDFGTRVWELFGIGAERTPEQDVEYSIGAIADIGVKALGTGLNDPSTANEAIDRLSEVLRELSGRREARVRAGNKGQPRLIARTTSFERAAGLAFDQLRREGAGNPTVVKRLLDAILSLMPLVGEAEADSLRREAHLLLLGARRECPDYEMPAIEMLAAPILEPSRAGAGN
jgi:uncharacterized membrane protein